MKSTSRTLLLVLVGLLLSALVGFFSFWSGDATGGALEWSSATAPATGGAKPGTRELPAPSSRGVLTHVEVRVEDLEGRAIAGAKIEYHGGVFDTDENGYARFALALETRDATVRSDTYMSWSGVLLEGEATKVRLTRELLVQVLAVDDSGQPLAGVDVWLARYRATVEALRASNRTLHSVTGKDGVARFAAVPMPSDGPYFLHVAHEEFVFCRQSQDKDQVHVFRHPGSYSVRARLVTPYVLAATVQGQQILTWSIELMGKAYNLPDNDEARWTCKRIADRIRGDFPTAIVLVLLPRYPAPADPEEFRDPRLNVWTVGRRPWSASCASVPVAEFVEPRQITPPRTPEFDAFGSLRVLVKDAAGNSLPTKAYRIQGVLGEEWGGQQRIVMTTEQASPDGWLTVPTGTWRVEFYDAVMNEVSKRATPVVVEKGGTAELPMTLEHEWVQCRFVATQGQGEPMPTGGFVRIEHAAAGIQTSLLRSSIMQEFDFWAPVGDVAIYAEGRAADVTRVLVGRTSLRVDGGEGRPMPVATVELLTRR